MIVKIIPNFIIEIKTNIYEKNFKNKKTSKIKINK